MKRMIETLMTFRMTKYGYTMVFTMHSCISDSSKRFIHSIHSIHFNLKYSRYDIYTIEHMTLFTCFMG